MAKVLVLTFSHLHDYALDSFRESFLDALVDEGNDVLLLRSEDFIERYFSNNELRPDVDEAMLNDFLREYDPDVVFSFNHSGMYPSLLEALPDTPVGIWMVDGPAYLVDKEVYQENASRYRSFLPSRAFFEELTEGYGTHPSTMEWVPFCSDFRPDGAGEQSIPISFVGTFFDRNTLKKALWGHYQNARRWERIKELFETYETDHETPFFDRVVRLRLEQVFTGPFEEAGVLNTISLNRRVHVLEPLADLGLQIFGNPGWLDAMPFSLKLVFAFQSRTVQNRGDLEDLYNQSKLIMSISHAQARGGVPWRVFDAMSSSGMLVSDSQQDMVDLFPGLDLPTYQTPQEAYDLCTAMLEDEDRRLDLVQRSHEVLDAGHRFRHRLESMGEALGVNLTGGSDGLLTRLDPVSFVPQATITDAPEATLGPARATGKKTRQVSRTRWLYRVYYADSLDFEGPSSVKIAHQLAPGDEVDTSLFIKEAPAYIRVDPGQWFSIQSEPKVWVAEADAPETKTTIDLVSGLMRTHQVHVTSGEEGLRMVCGSDPQIVFPNPFPGADIEVGYEATIERLL
jgi:hypothetical protein